MTSAEDIVGGAYCVSRGGKNESGQEGGCFSCSSFNVSSSALRTGSVELTKRTAPLTSPSSIFAEPI